MNRDYWYHFTRTPPGLGKRALVPRSSDLSPEFITRLLPSAKALYGTSLFVYAIPQSHFDSWEKTGQLQSLLDMIVTLDWFHYSVEQWRIDARRIDFSLALIRETYFISPQVLGFHDAQELSARQKETYQQAYIKLLNSVQPLSSYQGNFKNPEILLPFRIPPDCLTLEQVIE